MDFVDRSEGYAAELRDLFVRHEEADQERHDSLLTLITGIRSELTTLNGTVGALEFELGGAPKVPLRGKRKSVRERIHDLETDREAAKIAGAALEAARSLRGHTWSTWQKVSVVTFAGVAALSSVLRLFGVGG